MPDADVSVLAVRWNCAVEAESGWHKWFRALAIRDVSNSNLNQKKKNDVLCPGSMANARLDGSSVSNCRMKHRSVYRSKIQHALREEHGNGQPLASPNGKRQHAAAEKYFDLAGNGNWKQNTGKKIKNKNNAAIYPLAIRHRTVFFLTVFHCLSLCLAD